MTRPRSSEGSTWSTSSLRATASFNVKNDPANEAALKRIAAFATDRGIPLRLVVTPYLPERVEKIGNLGTWLTRVSELAGTGRVWNYAALLRDRSLFSDTSHMNARGARRLLEQMKEDGFYDPAATEDPVR